MSGIKTAAGTAASGEVTTTIDATDTTKCYLDVALPHTDADVGKVITSASVDDGSITGSVETRSIDVDEDFKLRLNGETLLDTETFDYVAQNTGKHHYVTTTMTSVWSAAGLTTNGASITTTTTGTQVRSYAMFPILGATQFYIETEMSFSAQPTTNTIIDFGGAITLATNPHTPADGVYFRLNSSGIVGVINSNGTETTLGAAVDFTEIDGSASYTNAKKYQFIIQVTTRRVLFWINNYLVGSIPTPSGQGQPCMAASLNWFIRHAIVGGAAGAVIQANVNNYAVSIGGSVYAETVGAQGNRALGSYQGMSGGTMGSLATYVNSTNPTAAAPSNTALTANLPGGLGGQGLVTAAVAAATDGIWSSYQNPAGTVNIAGRRMRITGVTISLLNLGAIVATTATAIQFSLAYGHTAVSMATAEAVGAKAPRRIPLGHATWAVGAAIGQGPQNGVIDIDFNNSPVFVNPSEFVALVGKFMAGTATASQTILFTLTYKYGWE